MEVPSLHGVNIDTGLLTMEKRVRIEESRRALTIGIPREVSNEERRVSLSPGGVQSLVNNGHQVFFEQGAGELAHFSDDEYANSGASVQASAADVYSQCELIVKVGPPSDEEMVFLQEKQIVISALHLGGMSPQFLQRLIDLGITAIGYEFIRDSDKSLPIVRMMHEIMGVMSVQIACRYLESSGGGKGVMLGGISGVPPSNVLILGAGVVGEWAARTALGFGANVIVLDTDLGALRTLEHYLNRQVTTAMATEQYIRGAVQSADVIIGAMMSAGRRSPVLVTEDMIASMRDGAVVVDAVIDQGGCIESSHATTHSDPVYRKHGVIHYCVPNMPSNAARTATYALTNVLVPYLINIGDAVSINEALWRNIGLRNGTYVYRRHLTKKSLAGMFNMPHRDIELLIASGI